MKKLYYSAAGYTVLGLLSGVFFREFTKLQNFTDVTVLSTLHVHALVLGTPVFLLLLLFEKTFAISKAKTFSKFFCLYHAGLLMTFALLWIRGILEVLDITVAKGMDAAVSGMAGIGHILLAAGLYFLFRMLRERCFEKG